MTLYIVTVSDDFGTYDYQYESYNHAIAHFNIEENVILFSYDCRTHDYSILKTKSAKDIFSFKDNEAILI